MNVLCGYFSININMHLNLQFVVSSLAYLLATDDELVSILKIIYSQFKKREFLLDM